MEKSLRLLKNEFESSSTRTPEYLEFHRTFKREFEKLLQPYTSRIEIGRTNHFDASGFFQLSNGTIFYFRIEDLRWNKEKMLIRTAKSFEDYTGGANNFISLDFNFVKNLFSFLGIK